MRVISQKLVEKGNVLAVRVSDPHNADSVSMFFFSLDLLHIVFNDPCLFNDCFVVYLLVLSHLVQCSRFPRITALLSKNPLL